jgi:hypothetical protein
MFAALFVEVMGIHLSKFGILNSATHKAKSATITSAPPAINAITSTTLGIGRYTRTNAQMCNPEQTDDANTRVRVSAANTMDDVRVETAMRMIEAMKENQMWNVKRKCISVVVRRDGW